MDRKIVKQDEECMNFSIISPIGKISVDMKDFEQAKKVAYQSTPNLSPTIENKNAEVYTM